MGEYDKQRNCSKWNGWGKPCCVPRQHFYEHGNLAAFRGNTFTNVETLLRSAATLLRAWKPCCVLRQHFYEREKLAAFCGNTFTSGKSLLRSAATLLRALKPCCVLRQAFNDSMLAAVVSCSPTSGRMRYAPTLSGEILTQNCTIHYRVLNEQMVNAVRPCSSPRSTYAK